MSPLPAAHPRRARRSSPGRDAARGTDDRGDEDRYEQFLAFALGYITHVGTDTIAHSFVNEQCGGPYRTTHRHHLIESHIDAWNYEQTGPGGTIPADPWGKRRTTRSCCRPCACGAADAG